jgi:hypothetical protein
LAESTFPLEDSLRPGSGSVVAAIDFSERSRHAARTAAGVATEFGLELVLRHVLKPIRTVLRWREQAAAPDKSRTTEAREQLDALAVALQPVTVTEILIVTGHPADDIAATAIQRKASVIAMDLGGDEGVFAPSPGSIAYRTLSLAPIPVLASDSCPQGGQHLTGEWARDAQLSVLSAAAWEPVLQNRQPAHRLKHPVGRIRVFASWSARSMLR